MKTLTIIALAFALTTPAMAEEAQRSALSTAAPGAAGAALIGLGIHSVVKDGRAISAERENIKFNTALSTDKKAELAKLEKARNEFLDSELKSARDRFSTFDKMRHELDMKYYQAGRRHDDAVKNVTKAESDFYKQHLHAPNVEDWKNDPALRAAVKEVADSEKYLGSIRLLPKYTYLQEYELLKEAERHAEEKWSTRFPEQSKEYYRLRNLLEGMESSITRSESEIAKRALTMKLKVGFMGLGAAAAGAYLLGNASTSASVIESQNFVGKHASSPVEGREEKAELVAPVN